MFKEIQSVVNPIRDDGISRLAVRFYSRGPGFPVLKNFCYDVRFQVLAVVRMKMFFWVVMSCRDVGSYQRCCEMQSPSSGIKLETVCFSETSVSAT